MSSHWEQVYKILEPHQLPWNAGGPDPDLVRLVDAAALPVGKALDAGTGLGHDAIFLALRGFSVLAVDIAGSALEAARENAGKAGAAGKIEFRQADIFELDLPAGSLALYYDRGLLHYFAPEDRKRCVERTRGWLAPEGRLLLRTFSDKEPPGIGPARLRGKELEELFAPSYELLEITEGVFAGPAKPKSWLCLLKPQN